MGSENEFPVEIVMDPEEPDIEVPDMTLTFPELE